MRRAVASPGRCWNGANRLDEKSATGSAERLVLMSREA